MVTKYQQSVGRKWHRNKDGKVAPCTASVKICPFLHYDTEVAAKDVIYRPGGQTIGSFAFGLKVEDGKVETVLPEGNVSDMRVISEKAKRMLQTTGKRPIPPTGEFTVDFGQGRKLSVQHDAVRVGKEIGSQYRFIYWDTSITYESESVILQSSSTKIHYQMLQSSLQLYFTKARDERVAELRKEGFMDDQLDEKIESYDKGVSSAYQTTLKTIDELEIMSKGAEKAHRRYGVDLFSRDKPGELRIDTDCKSSALQVYDIIESLGVHSAEDKEVQKISFHISDTTSSGDFGWAVSRIPEGNWYLSYFTDKETFSHEMEPSRSKEARQIIEGVLSQDGVSEKIIQERSDFAYQLLTEVEPAIQSYERTVRSKGESRENGKTEPTIPTPKPISMKERLVGLFM